MDLQRRFAVGDGRADFQHVRAEDLLVLRIEMICESSMNEVPPGRPMAMTFIARNSAAVFQSPSAPKAVAIGHEPLGGNAGQLRQPAQILKRGGEALEISGLQKRAQPSSMRAASRTEPCRAPPLRKSAAIW